MFLFLPAQFNLSWAYDGVVHKKIDEYAAKPGVSQLDFVLKNQLGLTVGIETKFKKQKKDQKAWEWIAYGGEAEDYGKGGQYDYLRTRGFNHFHDPLKGWDEAGFDKFLLNEIYQLNYGRDPVSSILWGLDPDTQDFSKNKTS